VHPDGSQLTKLTNASFAADPQWSPDGRPITYDRNNGIFVTDAHGSDKNLLFARRLNKGLVFLPGNLV
jgi:hypothetical protein